MSHFFLKNGLNYYPKEQAIFLKINVRTKVIKPLELFHFR